VLLLMMIAVIFPDGRRFLRGKGASLTIAGLLIYTKTGGFSGLILCKKDRTGRKSSGFPEIINVLLIISGFSSAKAAFFGQKAGRQRVLHKNEREKMARFV